jgi:histidine ammonia-lyase
MRKGTLSIRNRFSTSVRYHHVSNEISNSIERINSLVLFSRKNESNIVNLDGHSLKLEDLIALGSGSKALISLETLKRLGESRAVVDRIVESRVPTYGINTGFGLLSHTNVSYLELSDLQHNLIRSHASGVGEPLSPEVVRRVMALRINTLARARSGISLETFEALIKLFNSGCTPEVPSQGTVGASGLTVFLIE